MSDDERLLREMGDACRRSGQCPTCGGKVNPANGLALADTGTLTDEMIESERDNRPFPGRDDAERVLSGFAFIDGAKWAREVLTCNSR